MLNERLCKYCNFGDEDGLYFVYKALADGFSSLVSLKKKAFLNPGSVDADVDAIVLLYNTLGIINFHHNSIEINDIKSMDKSSFLHFLSKKVISFALNEKLINFETLAYDLAEDKIYISKSCIKLKYAFLRNLMITLHLLEKRTISTFYVKQALVKSATPLLQAKRKITQEELLLKVEQERVQGESGELFVLEYEKKRLGKRTDLELIKRISLYDVSAGYDIVSFNSETSPNLDRLIEVKTFTGKPHFHWSLNESNVAKLKHANYFLYLVSYEEMDKDGYSPIIIHDPIKYFETHSNWQFTIDGYLVNKID